MEVTEVQKFLSKDGGSGLEEVKADQMEAWKSGGMKPIEVIIEEPRQSIQSETYTSAERASLSGS